MPHDYVVTELDFPHGLRCMDCDEVIEPGQVYSERLRGMIGGDFFVELVCPPCALGKGAA